MRAVTQILTKAVRTPAKVPLQKIVWQIYKLFTAYSPIISNEFLINVKYYFKAVTVKIAKRNYSSEVNYQISSVLFIN